MRRRAFITLVTGAAAAWPLVARAQQGKLPTIGFLGGSSAAATSSWTATFVKRFRELDWIEGKNVAIEYRWAEGRTDRPAEIVAVRSDQCQRHRHGRDGIGHRCQADDVGDPDRVRDGGRSSRKWFGRKFGAAGRQRDRPVQSAD